MTNRSRRAKPVVAKAGVTRNPKRRYCGGGKLFSKGGRMKRSCR